MADALSNLDKFIPNYTLVLNVLRVLKEKYSSIRLHHMRGRPFPTFLEPNLTCTYERSLFDIGK